MFNFIDALDPILLFLTAAGILVVLLPALIVDRTIGGINIFKNKKKVLTKRSSLSSMTKDFTSIKKEKIMATQTINGVTYDQVNTYDPNILVLRRSAATATACADKIKPGMLVAFKRTPSILRPVIKVEAGKVYTWKRDREDDNLLTTETTFGPLENLHEAFDTAGRKIICNGQAC